MKQDQGILADCRADTDASLRAERNGIDRAGDVAAAIEQRVQDDLIEHDRIAADERLYKFREGADKALARERAESPPPDSAVQTERKAADKDKKTERTVTDALVDGKRQRADAETQAPRQEADRREVRALRLDTDQHLSQERNVADATRAVHDQTVVALEKAENAETRNGEILALVTHDLRSPLSIILLNAQNIAESTKEPTTRDIAKEMVRAAARMGRLLTDLVDVARVESGAFRIVRRPYDVNALLSEVFQTYRPLFAERGLTFVVDAPDESVVASFDHDRIVQVLSNLFGNALKFTPKQGTIVLHVVVRVEEIEFVLRDSGPGIQQSALPHVFKRFWQIDSDAHRGLGLGLYICEQIIVAHGGRIWVESDFGNGATFRFTLPRAA